MTATLRLEVSEGVATLALDRPAQLNAIDKAMALGLVDALDRLATDPRVRAVVLTGAGRAFSAGGDRKEPLADSAMGTGTPEERAGGLRGVMRATELLRQMPKVTIAAVNGVCVGAGLALACAADVRVASTAARFGTAFVAAALPGDYGITWLLPRLVGEAAARELYLLGELVDAAEAHRIGLVGRCVPPDDFERVVAEVAARAAAMPAAAVGLAKQNLADSPDVSLAVAMDLEAARTIEAIDSAEAARARDEFHRRGAGSGA